MDRPSSRVVPRRAGTSPLRLGEGGSPGSCYRRVEGCGWRWLGRRSGAATRPLRCRADPAAAGAGDDVVWRHVRVIVAGQATIPLQRIAAGPNPLQSATSSRISVSSSKISALDRYLTFAERDLGHRAEAGARSWRREIDVAQDGRHRRRASCMPMRDAGVALRDYRAIHRAVAC